MNSPSRIKCHVSLGPFCIHGEQLKDVGPDYLKAYIAYLELYNPDIKLNNNECVKAMYYSDYELAKESFSTKGSDDIQTALMIAGGGLLLAIILLALTYLIGKKKTKEMALECEED